ncbi:MAG: septum formation protein Maf [Gammaproteobacteria bacterium]|nr:septum formation protein Maf [Gammaproteobacteria bacterium]
MDRGRRIILASGSPYRRELLSRLQVRFSCLDPGTVESARPGEAPATLVRRLAAAKAECIARIEPDAIVIGADQVAVLDGAVLVKPGNHDRAVAQLRGMRGRRVNFITGLCVLDPAAESRQLTTVDYPVVFRDYSDAEIERYLSREMPYDCAASFKSERLGIALVDRMEGSDPSALIGLPLVELARMLRRAGIDVP